MPLTDKDPNVRNRDSLSRASNISSKTAGQKDARTPTVRKGAPTPSTLTNPAGVISMLRTTTELGGLDTLPLRQNRLPKTHNPPRRPSNNVAPSRTSSHYSRTGSRADSIRSKALSLHSNGDYRLPGQWPHHRYAQTNSLDLPLDTRSHYSSNSIPSTSDRYVLDQRSYSLTTTMPQQRRPSNHASLQNLRADVQMSSRPHSPYRYPARLRRQGYRPDSPALSDTLHPLRNGLMPIRSGPGPRAIPASPLQYHNRQPSNHADSRSPQSAFQDRSSRQHFEAEYGVQPSHRPIPKQSKSTGPFELPNNQLGRSRSIASKSSIPYGKVAPPLKTGTPNTTNNERPGNADGEHPNRAHPADIAPYTGFVKRVKKVLEERASMDEARAPFIRNPRPKRDFAKSNETHTAELEATPEIKRLTREMIKAATGPPSDTGAVSPEAPASVVSLLHAPGSSASSMIEKYSVEDARSFSSLEPFNKGSAVDQGTALSIGHQASIVDYETKLSTVHAMADVTPYHSQSVPETCVENGEAPNAAGPNVEDGNMPAGNQEVSVSDQFCLPRFIGPRPLSMPIRSHHNTSRSQVERRSMPVPADVAPRPTPDNSTSRDNVHTSDRHVDKEGLVPEEPAPSAVQTMVQPETVSDNSKWLSSSIIARTSSNLESSRSSASSALTMQPIVPGGTESVASPAPLYSSGLGTLRGSVVSVESSSGSALSASAMNDSRLSAIKQFQFPMPDLTEDSQEDASTTNLRMLGSRLSGVRGGAPKKKREYRGPARNDAIPSRAPAPSSYVSRKLSDTKNMPSLNFSHTDLTTKLNLALGMQATTLSEAPQDPALSFGGLPAVPERPESSVLIRERYKSFFSEVDSENETCSCEDDGLEVMPVDEELMNEIDRLSIPSVNGLTVRLSELIPKIKKGKSFLDITSSDEALETTVDEIRCLGSAGRLGSLDRKRASLMSALTAGSVAQSRRSGNSRILPEQRPPGLMKNLPPLPTECKDPRPSFSSDATVRLDERGTQTTTTGSTTTRLPELEATVIIEYPAIRGSVDSAGPGRLRQQAFKHQRQCASRQSSPTVGRASAVEAHVDDTLDLSMKQRDEHAASKPVQSEIKPTGSTSMMNLPHGGPERIARSMSPGPHMEANLVPQVDETMGVEKQGQKQRTKTIIGSLQRKIGIKPYQAGKAGFPVDPKFFHPGERVLSAPGDRYPTTALTPPSQANIDETRSFFSDDSSEEEEARTTGLRKRLTRLRYRHSVNAGQRRVSSRAMSVPESQVGMHPSTPWLEQLGESNSGDSDATQQDVLVVYDEPPSGMSRFEFRAKRVLEKLRILWSRSGQYIRSKSRARKQAPSWDADSDVFDT